MTRAALLLLLLTGCGATPAQVGFGAVAVGAGSIAAIGRTPVDAAVSVVSGRDCSIVHWDQGKSYCKPDEPKPDVPPYCTRSLGVVDCWADPASVPNRAPEVADGPRALTPVQEKDRTKGWPDW